MGLLDSSWGVARGSTADNRNSAIISTPKGPAASGEVFKAQIYHFWGVQKGCHENPKINNSSLDA